MKKLKVIIDNGHGCNTPGKRSPDGSLLEWKYTREIAMRVMVELIAHGVDAERIVKEDIDISLPERCRRANKIYKDSNGNSILVSIHLNAAGNGEWMNAHGWEIWTSVGQTKSDILADHIAIAAAKELPGVKIRTDMSDGDVDKESGFYILKNTLCPAVLTENLFQDNKIEVGFLLSEEGKQKIVDLHVNGILDYLKSAK